MSASSVEPSDADIAGNAPRRGRARVPDASLTFLSAPRTAEQKMSRITPEWNDFHNTDSQHRIHAASYGMTEPNALSPRSRSLFEHVPVAPMLVDPTGRIFLANSLTAGILRNPTIILTGNDTPADRARHGARCTRLSQQTSGCRNPVGRHQRRHLVHRLPQTTRS